MKKSLSILLLFICMTASAQKRDNIRQRIASQRIAYITNKLSLSPEEAQKFWPVYNKFTAEIEDIRKEIIQSRKSSNEQLSLMSDKETEKYLELTLNQQQKLIDLQRKYQKELKTAIPVQKIAMLYKAEFDFKKELLKRIRNSGNDLQSGDSDEE